MNTMEQLPIDKMQLELNAFLVFCLIKAAQADLKDGTGTRGTVEAIEDDFDKVKFLCDGSDNFVSQLDSAVSDWRSDKNIETRATCRNIARTLLNVNSDFGFFTNEKLSKKPGYVKMQELLNVRFTTQPAQTVYVIPS